MPEAATTIATRDHWVEHPRGRLFARIWTPSEVLSATHARSPIVLFHDSLGCVELWRSFPAALCAATGRRVIAYDRLGFGRSSPRTDRLHPSFIPEEAETTLPLLGAQLDFARFIALGHSVGGGMAVHCAARHPTRCEALITIAAQAFVEDRTRQGIIEARELFRQPGQFERLQRYHGDKTRWVLEAWIETWLAPEFADWSLRETLPKVACPTLVIHGSEDEYGSTVHPKLIAELTSGPSRLEIMLGVRHVPHREQESRVVACVADFLAAHYT